MGTGGLVPASQLCWAFQRREFSWECPSLAKINCFYLNIAIPPCLLPLSTRPRREGCSSVPGHKQGVKSFYLILSGWVKTRGLKCKIGVKCFKKAHPQQEELCWWPAAADVLDSRALGKEHGAAENRKSPTPGPELFPALPRAAPAGTEPFLQGFGATLELFWISESERARWLLHSAQMASPALCGTHLRWLSPIHSVFPKFLGILWCHKYLKKNNLV